MANKELKLLPFDLEKALNGAKVVTRDGRRVRRLERTRDPYKYSAISGLVAGTAWISWSAEGRYGTAESSYDLFLLDESEEPTGYKTEPVEPSENVGQLRARVLTAVARDKDTKETQIVFWDNEAEQFATMVDGEKMYCSNIEILRAVGNMLIEKTPADNPSYEIRPFDLETAKKHPEWLYTRDGSKARILCDDLKAKFPLIVAIETADGGECYDEYFLSGVNYDPLDSDSDLVFRVPNLPKIVKYANYYQDSDDVIYSDTIYALYDTPEEAKKEAIKSRPSIVVKIEYEGLA